MEGRETCALCMQRGHTEPCKADGNLDREIDLLVSGSPCDPFSTQRNKRFHETSVSDHADFSVTMDTVYHGFCKERVLFSFCHFLLSVRLHCKDQTILFLPLVYNDIMFVFDAWMIL